MGGAAMSARVQFEERSCMSALSLRTSMASVYSMGLGRPHRHVLSRGERAYGCWQALCENAVTMDLSVVTQS